MTRPIWTLCGLSALALGAVGAVLPILPTTPLVILAAFCFAKGSPRLEQMLINHRTFGPMIADWRARGAIARRYKIMAAGMMAAAFALSLVLGLRPLVLGIQAICLAGAATYVWTRPDV